MKDDLVSLHEPADVDSFISLRNKLDNRLCSRRCQSTQSKASTPFSGFSASLTPPAFLSPKPPEEPMPLGQAYLTPEEKMRQRQAGKCIYCGTKGHFLSTCAVRPKGLTHQ